MGYAKIKNLYADQTVLLFKELYALEKIHGTSANVRWDGKELHFFSGGANHKTFVDLFDVGVLGSLFKELGHDKVRVHGEAYGGKMQGMSKLYGPQLRFVAFDVNINEKWLDVPDAEDVSRKLNLDFVHYVRVSTDLDCLNELRDAPSVQATKLGFHPTAREGVVLRPLTVMYDKNGNRICAKHKGDAFRETHSVRKVKPSQVQETLQAESAALEYVTDMRMNHVLDKLGNPGDISKTGEVIKAMVSDVYSECEGEVLDNKITRKAISKAAADMFKKRVTKVLG